MQQGTVAAQRYNKCHHFKRYVEHFTLKKTSSIPFSKLHSFLHPDEFDLRVDLAAPAYTSRGHYRLIKYRHSEKIL